MFLLSHTPSEIMEAVVFGSEYKRIRDELLATNARGELPLTWRELQNVIWMTTVEDNSVLADRLSALESAPVAWRGLSCEPLLEEIDLSEHLHWMDWVVVGCESGDTRRAMEREWIDALYQQTRQQQVPMFLKQAVYCARFMKVPDIYDGKPLIEFPPVGYGASHT